MLYKPWEGKRSKGDLWVKQGKKVYNATEAEEWKRGGPIAEPKTVVQALQQYEDWPSEKTYMTLKKMYEAIPRDERRFCLHDMDYKDGPVRAALYGGCSG